MSATEARPTLMRAAVVTVVVTLSGSALGLLRDLLLARFFGANGGTDAFLVAWTVPETAFTLVVEGAMSFLMIPLFSRALTGRTPMREVVAATLPRVTVALVAASAVVAAGAPVLVHAIAPGLADPGLAVTCTRLTSVTVLMFGLAGYASAALRANHVFGPPATIHLSYNIGILGLMATLGGRLGIVSAAAGVAVGSTLMVLAQLPSFLRHVGLPRSWRSTGPTVTLGAFAPLAVYTIARQAQVFVERYLGSSLPPGTISHLNYAQKVAQMPMLVALLICTVTFPSLARSVASGEARAARERLEADLRTVIALIFVSAAYLIAFAPQVVAVLLEHGEFSAADTVATASILRVYAVGLVGHALVGALSRAFYTGERRSWYPAAAMGVGLAVTALLAVGGVSLFHAYAIAAANGVGIVTAAVLLMFGLRDRVVAISLRSVAAGAARLGAAAVAAGALGWLVAGLTAGQPPALTAVAGGVLVLLVFAGVAHLAGAPEIAMLTAQVRRRIPHGR